MKKKKKKNQARYEIFRQKPLTLTLLLDVQKHPVALKGLKEVSSKKQDGCSGGHSTHLFEWVITFIEHLEAPPSLKLGAYTKKNLISKSCDA